MTVLCGGKTRAGGRCARPKGWGTDHAGSGRCKFHGGSSPSGRKAAAKEAALEFVRGAMGAALVASPLDVLQGSVDLSWGEVDYYRHEIVKAWQKDDQAKLDALRPNYEAAIERAGKMSKAAVDAGVVKRRQRLAERQADVLVAAITDALQEAYGDLATAERQTIFAQVLRERLMLLESGDDDVPPRLPRAA